MRIISGKLKGIKLNYNSKFKVRPTTDRSKESIFNILDNLFEFDQITVLDLFSGTGNISFEFISRGVRDVTSVDISSDSIRHIKKIANENNIQINVIRKNIFKSLSTFKYKYDIIFADPPYNIDYSELEKFVEYITNKKTCLLNENGILILEHKNQYDFKKINSFYRIQKYGSCSFSFFNTLNTKK